MTKFESFRHLLKILSHTSGVVVLVFFCGIGVGRTQSNARARDLGIPFDGTTGRFNAITDVKDVEVGNTTLISGDGPLKVGVGPIRTGVTAVFTRGKDSRDPVIAGWFTQNGNGTMTDLEEMDTRSYVAEPDRGRRDWDAKPDAPAAVYANRRRTRGKRGKELMRQRGELIERSFAHNYETGAMRRTHLKH